MNTGAKLSFKENLIPDGFRWDSGGNDACPSIYSESKDITIFTDYDNFKDRESGGEFIYTLYEDTLDNGCSESSLETDNWDDVLEFLELK